MSMAFVPPSLRGNVADQQATVQKLLDENSRLIDIIVEYQNQGRGDEALKHHKLLHRNLVHLAQLADQSLLPQLREDDAAKDSNGGPELAPGQPGIPTIIHPQLQQMQGPPGSMASPAFGQPPPMGYRPVPPGQGPPQGYPQPQYPGGPGPMRQHFMPPPGMPPQQPFDPSQGGHSMYQGQPPPQQPHYPRPQW